MPSSLLLVTTSPLYSRIVTTVTTVTPVDLLNDRLKGRILLVLESILVV